MRSDPRQRIRTLTIRQLRGATMSDPQRPGRDVPTDRLANQRVGEPERPGRRQDLRHRQPVCRQLPNHRIQTDQRRRERHLNASAEHDQRARQRDRLITQPPQPPTHRSSNSTLSRQPDSTHARRPFRQRSRARRHGSAAEPGSVRINRIAVDVLSAPGHKKPADENCRRPVTGTVGSGSPCRPLFPPVAGRSGPRQIAASRLANRSRPSAKRRRNRR
jgi:hypothetical protein